MKRALRFAALLFPATALAVGTSNWIHTSEADFKQGTFHNVVATNLGDLKLSRAVKTLLEQDAHVSAVYALAEGKDGTIYAATGPEGVLLAIKDGAVAMRLPIPDATNLFCLLSGEKGDLLIGTGGEKGQIVRLKPDQKPQVIFSADGVQYVWAMARTADGMLYAATGPEGQLFQIRPDDTHEILFDSNENNLLSLLSDGKDHLYVGTDPNGLVYRVNRKSREVFVLFDAAESEISALALDAAGNLYAGTAEASAEPAAMPEAASAEQQGRPEGGSSGVPIPSQPPQEPEPPKLPDPNPGEPEPIPKAAPKSLPERSAPVEADDEPDAPQPPPAAGALSATQPAGAGAALMASTHADKPRPEGNAIYRIDPAGFVTEIFRQNVLVLSLLERDGTLLAGTGSEGLIYQVDPAAEETVVLAKVDPKQVVCLLSASNGQVYLGLANVGGIAAMSSGFAQHGTYVSAVLDAQQVSRFGKMRLHGTLPGETGLSIATRSGNTKDPADVGWSKWSDETPASEFVQIPSPAARYLQYRLSFNSPRGQQTPVVEDVNVAYQVPNLPPQVTSIRISDGGAAQGGPPGRVQNITWSASDPNGDALIYTLYFRSDARGPWILLKDKQKEPTFEWETRSVGDGRYEVKVVASDAAANPTGTGRTASRVSDPVWVDNTGPVIGDMKWHSRGAQVRVEFKAVDRSGTLAALHYSVDANDDWQAVLPSDNILDSPEETAGFVVTGLDAGPHQITVRATDSRDNQAYETVLVNVDPPRAGK